MLIGRIENANVMLGAPADWNEETDGLCGVLPVLVEVQDRLPVMTSAWLPTPEEAAAIAAGAPVYLRVVGQSHPPVMIWAGEAPQ